MGRTRRVAASLLAGGLGWVAGSLFFVLYTTLRLAPFTDALILVPFTLPFAACGWGLTFLPLILLLPADSPLFRLRYFVPLGTGCALAAYYVLTALAFGWPAHAEWASTETIAAYVGHAAITGAVAATFYSLGLRRSTQVDES